MLCLIGSREGIMTISSHIDSPARSDLDLVGDCRRGDAGSLAELVERYQTAVFGTCLRLVRDRDAALELTNGIFYKAYQRLDQFDTSRPLRPWLLRIATNEALNYLRGQQQTREQTITGPESSDLAAQVAGPDDLVADVLTGERHRTVRAAVNGLPEHYRLLIILRFFNDLSYNEIAEQTGLPVNTIGVQLSRARALLRRSLEDQEVVDAPSS